MTQFRGDASSHIIIYPSSWGVTRISLCILSITIVVCSLLHFNNLPINQQITLHNFAGRSQSGKNAKTDNIPVAIFYNAYIPPDDPEGIKRSYNIIEEQMAQVDESAISSRVNVNLYYVSIGEPFNTTFMDDLCTKYQLKCTHVHHYEKGYEMTTEQTILDYCKEAENESHIVSYFHNKGALHPHPDQDTSRQLLTRSALSKECIGLLDAQQCNVCGSNFRSVWGPTYWGNMWSAKCNYVKKLTSPFDLEAKNNLALQTMPEEMTMSLYSQNMERFALGKDRYAAEQFVGNHPSLIPCSHKGDHGEFWSVDPPGAFESFMIPAQTLKVVLDEMMANNNHLKEWYLLPGILWRYHIIYNELPSSDSWIWRHYPDGDNWKKAIEEKGFPEALYHRIATETS